MCWRKVGGCLYFFWDNNSLPFSSSPSSKFNRYKNKLRSCSLLFDYLSLSLCCVKHVPQREDDGGEIWTPRKLIILYPDMKRVSHYTRRTASFSTKMSIISLVFSPGILFHENNVKHFQRLSWTPRMSSLKLQKRLAADVMKCGKKKVKISSSSSDRKISIFLLWW